MMNYRKKYNFRRIISLVLFTMMFFNITSVYAANINMEENSNASFINSKIDPELQEVMDEAEADELIPVWLWRESLDEDIVEQLMIKEQGMDPAIYEDEVKFNANRLPQIEKQVEAELGYEKAHTAIQSDEVKTVSNPTLTDIVVETQAGRTPIDEAVAKEFDEFIMAKRRIQKREQSACNQDFIDEHIKQFGEREIMYNGEYTSTLIVNATKAEINYYAQLNSINGLSVYREADVKPALNIALEQVGVYSEGGTGYDAFGWLGQDGYGVKVGIVEVGSGRYDSNAPHLSGNDNLNYVDNYYENGKLVSPIIKNHATMVTSIIVGKRKVKDSKAYKGVAPCAIVYQTAADNNPLSVFNGVKALMNMGVDVINLSLEIRTEKKSVYTSYDKEFDQLIAEKNVVVVSATGNNNDYVAAPGKALNVISVGAVKTKESSDEGTNIPFEVADYSSYHEDTYLPNKPDIVAPGSNISIVGIDGELYTDSGTSYATPIITGIIAQMMSENPTLKGNPLAVKAALLLGGSHSKLDVTNDSYLATGIHAKSGAGLIDARYALGRISGSTKINMDLESSSESNRYYFTEGDLVHAVMVFDKKNDVLITNQVETDDLDLILKKDEDDSIVSFSKSGRNNVEIIRFRITESGYYYFDIEEYRIVDSEKIPDVAIAFRILE